MLIDQSIKEFRMARTRGDLFEARRQKILDGALEVFARKGFARATNVDIAHAAGLGSAALIYHYFEDKRDLLDHVMQERVPILQLLASPAGLMDLEPRDLMTRFATSLLVALETPQAAAFMKVMFGEAARDPEFARMYGRLGPLRAIEFLSTYLQTQMDAGKLRMADPAAAARCFLGPLIIYVLSREMLHLPDAEGLTLDTMAETCVSVFLDGLRVD